jgi:hypothetical protein
MCPDEHMMPMTKFLLGVAAIVAAFMVISLMTENCRGQQPNHDNASLQFSYGGTFYPADGAAGGPWGWNCPSSPVLAVTRIAGQVCRYYEVWGHTSSPLLNGGNASNYGIVDLDPQQSWSLIRAATFIGCGSSGLTFDDVYFWTPAASTAWSLQAWVVDPTHPYGTRLTGCVYLYN